METENERTIGVVFDRKYLLFLDYMKEQYGSPYSVTIRRSLKLLMEKEKYQNTSGQTQGKGDHPICSSPPSPEDQYGEVKE